MKILKEIKFQIFYNNNYLKVDTYIKEKITDNYKFLNILRQYDEILSKTKDKETISVICNQVLSQYEELVNGEF